MRMLRFLPALAFAVFLNAQPAQVQVNADCVVAFTINGTGPSSGSFDNRQVGCNSWQLQYGSTGFSAVTLALQSATDNATWGTMAGTVLFGTNPLTSTTGASMLLNSYGTSFAPYVRVQATTATGTGTIIGILLGYRAAGTGGSSGGGGASSNVNVSQYGGTNVVSAGLAGLFAMGGAAASGSALTGNPILVAGSDGTDARNLRTDTAGAVTPSGASTALADGTSNTQNLPQTSQAGTPGVAGSPVFPFIFNGATWDRDFTCGNSVQVALSGTAYTQIVAASGATVIRVCKLFVTSASVGTPNTNTFNVAFGTCAGTPTQILTAAGVTGLDSDFGGALRGAAGAAMCIKEATANSDPVTVTYAQF